VLLNSLTSLIGLVLVHTITTLADKLLSYTVATLKCATQQNPKCMQRFPFSSLGRKLESVPSTQELHTSGLGCQMRFVNIPAILSTVQDLSYDVVRKQPRENRETISVVN